MSPEPPAGTVRDVWWHSKKLLVVIAHHVVTSLAALVGILHYPSSTGTILAGLFTSASTVTVAHLGSQAATDRAQAYSPNYPAPPHMVTPPAPESSAAPPPSPGSTPGMNI